MNHPDLNRQIVALTTELAGLGSVDQSTRKLLTALQREISRLDESSFDGITDRLEELAVRFEADHPAAGTALRQAIDALGKAGI